MIVEEALKSSGIDRLDAEVLLAHALGKNREWLVMNPQVDIDTAHFTELVSRRKTHEPVAYIVESQDFYGRDFMVDKRVLIPRDSTERLVDLTLDFLKDGEDCIRELDIKIVGVARSFGSLTSVDTIVDLCTGSGCIAITLALETNKKIIATDISTDALDVAKMNAKTHGVLDRIDFRLGDLTDPMVDLREDFIVVTNPPYIPENDKLMPDVADFEPHIALFSGKTGSDAICRLYANLSRMELCRGCILECRDEHVRAIEKGETLTFPSTRNIPYNRAVSSIQNTLGPVTSVIGAQWGDEGKGKIVDILASEYDVIARACGGANAGHTIVVKGEKHVFHLLPSGCLHEGKDIVLGSGLVIHLPTLLTEIQTLEGYGISILDRLHISHAAHIVFDYHKEIDGVLEDMRAQPIGTTKRGIGPAYMDKAARTGIRMENLGDDHSKEMNARVESVQKMYGVDVDANLELQSLADAQSVVGHCVKNTVEFLAKAQASGKTLLIEGAQAVLLDIDHGTYPFVTSSSTTLAGALQGLGIAPMCVQSCVGVAKAYCTRVGEGDFATEAQGEAQVRLRERGGEYGSTTGRPRRTGWLNIDQLNIANSMNGFTSWNVTKLDVLDEEEVIPVMINGKLEELPGWKVSTAGLTEFDQLPENAQNYVLRIEEETSVPAMFIGTGPGREEMITRT